MPASGPQMTTQTLRLLAVLLERPDDASWGLALTRATGLKTGTAYPILARPERAGMLASEWEAETPDGRPRRRYYRLTETGISQARVAVEREREALRLGRWETQ